MQCEYAAMEAGALKKHVESKHEEVRYPCPQCVYVGNKSSSLKKHVKNKHEEVRYPCT